MATTSEPEQGACQIDIEQDNVGPNNSKKAESSSSCVDSIFTGIKAKFDRVQSILDFQPTSIWRVSPQLKKLGSEAFEPKMFSIGPIHHGKRRLRRGEELKLQLLKLLTEENSELLHTFVGQCYDCVHIAREQYPANSKTIIRQGIRGDASC